MTTTTEPPRFPVLPPWEPRNLHAALTAQNGSSPHGRQTFVLTGWQIAGDYQH